MRQRKPMFLLATAVLIAAAPLRVDWTCAVPHVLTGEAAAKEGNNGNGNGGGKGSSASNGTGNNGNTGIAGNNGRATGKSGRNSAASADAVIDKEVTRDSVGIRYRNGYRERVVKGRFIMKDAKGRTIIDRRATAVDRMRLWLKQAVQ